MKQLPLYEQIYNDIIEGIENGTYKKGDRLPSEKELSEKYCVSRITSKKALELLAEEGRIIRMAGKGSFVSGAELTEEVQAAEEEELRAEFRLPPAGKPGNGMQKPGLQHGAPLLLRKYRRRNQGH